MASFRWGRLLGALSILGVALAAVGLTWMWSTAAASASDAAALAMPGFDRAEQPSDQLPTDFVRHLRADGLEFENGASRRLSTDGNASYFAVRAVTSHGDPVACVAIHGEEPSRAGALGCAPEERFRTHGISLYKQNSAGFSRGAVLMPNSVDLVDPEWRSRAATGVIVVGPEDAAVGGTVIEGVVRTTGTRVVLTIPAPPGPPSD